MHRGLACQRTKGSLKKRLRSVLCLGCPLSADNSTLTAREVFSPTYTPPVKMHLIYFLPAGKKLCESFFKLSVPHIPQTQSLRRGGEARVFPVTALQRRGDVIRVTLAAPGFDKCPDDDAYHII